MTYADVMQALRERPFRPFQIVMSNGERHEVLHPELAKNTLTAVYLYRPSMDDESIPETWLATCSMQNIATIEPIPGASAKRVA